MCVGGGGGGGGGAWGAFAQSDQSLRCPHEESLGP